MKFYVFKDYTNHLYFTPFEVDDRYTFLKEYIGECETLTKALKYLETADYNVPFSEAVLTMAKFCSESTIDFMVELLYDKDFSQDSKEDEKIKKKICLEYLSKHDLIDETFDNYIS